MISPEAAGVPLNSHQGGWRRTLGTAPPLPLMLHTPRSVRLNPPPPQISLAASPQINVDTQFKLLSKYGCIHLELKLSPTSDPLSASTSFFSASSPPYLPISGLSQHLVAKFNMEMRVKISFSDYTKTRHRRVACRHA